MAVSQVQAAGTADLSGDIVHAVEGPGRDTDGTGEVDAGFHQGIQHPAGIETAESTTLQNNTSFRQLFRCQTLREAVQSGKTLFFLFIAVTPHLCFLSGKRRKIPRAAPIITQKKSKLKCRMYFLKKWSCIMKRPHYNSRRIKPIKLLGIQKLFPRNGRNGGNYVRTNS